MVLFHLSHQMKEKHVCSPVKLPLMPELFDKATIKPESPKKIIPNKNIQ